jgi:hypothetical protein
MIKTFSNHFVPLPPQNQQRFDVLEPYSMSTFKNPNQVSKRYNM